MRFYTSNDSYPELRETPERWRRHRLWWRAFASGVLDWRLVLVAAAQSACGLLAGMLVLRALIMPTAAGGLRTALLSLAAAAVLGALAVLALSLAGDLVRPHLRRVSEAARHACPNCGHSLRPQVESGVDAIRCTECGMGFDRTPFDPPYRIPPACRRFRFRRAHGD